MSSPHITVLIPTRERADVLHYALKTVLAQDYDNLSIIVSDNCSKDDTREVVHELADERVRYINPGKRLSMSHHWEFALSHVEEGWVTIVGDDDGLLPDSLQHVAAIIDRTQAKAIRSQLCTYSWPSHLDSAFGKLHIENVFPHEELRNARAWRERALRGDADFRELPVLYTGGYVHTSVIEEIKKRSGGIFYRSCIPDVYSGMAISSVIDNYLFTTYPLGIGGTSRHSTGRAFVEAKRTRENPVISAKAKFLSENNIPIHEAIPPEADGSPPINLQGLLFESYFQSAPLHNDDINKWTPERILESLLYRGLVVPKEYRRTKDWIDRFARIHDLDRRIPARRALIRYVQNGLRPSTLADWTRSVSGSFSFKGNAQKPLATVEEASQFALRILQEKPHTRNYARAIKLLPKRFYKSVRNVLSFLYSG